MAAVQTAGRSDTARPNIFELRYEDTKITYSPSALDGAPLLHYDGPMGEHSFSGDEIQTFNSARGLEVSVTLERFSRLRLITLTVFLPDLEIEDPTAELSFRTVGIHSTRRRAMTSDAGEMISSEPLELAGMADRVLVLREHTVVEDIPRSALTHEALLHAASAGLPAAAVPGRAALVRTENEHDG